MSQRNPDSSDRTDTDTRIDQIRNRLSRYVPGDGEAIANRALEQIRGDDSEQSDGNSETASDENESRSSNFGLIGEDEAGDVQNEVDVGGTQSDQGLSSVEEKIRNATEQTEAATDTTTREGGDVTGTQDSEPSSPSRPDSPSQDTESQPESPNFGLIDEDEAGDVQDEVDVGETRSDQSQSDVEEQFRDATDQTDTATETTSLVGSDVTSNETDRSDSTRPDGVDQQTTGSDPTRSDRSANSDTRTETDRTNESDTGPRSTQEVDVPLVGTREVSVPDELSESQSSTQRPVEIDSSRIEDAEFDPSADASIREQAAPVFDDAIQGVNITKGDVAFRGGRVFLAGSGLEKIRNARENRVATDAAERFEAEFGIDADPSEFEVREVDRDIDDDGVSESVLEPQPSDDLRRRAEAERVSDRLGVDVSSDEVILQDGEVDVLFEARRRAIAQNVDDQFESDVTADDIVALGNQSDVGDNVVPLRTGGENGENEPQFGIRDKNVARELIAPQLDERFGEADIGQADIVFNDGEAVLSESGKEKVRSQSTTFNLEGFEATESLSEESFEDAAAERFGVDAEFVQAEIVGDGEIRAFVGQSDGQIQPQSGESGDMAVFESEPDPRVREPVGLEQETQAPSASQVEDIESTPLENIGGAVVDTSDATVQSLSAFGDAADTVRTEVLDPTASTIGAVFEGQVTSQEDVLALLNTEGADVIQTGEREDFEPETTTGQQVESTSRGILETGAMVIEGPQTVAQLGDTAVDASAFTAEQIGEEGVVEGLQTSGEAGAMVGAEIATQALESAQNRPFFTAGTLLGTAGVIGGASRLSGVGGRATAAAIQPGEELLSAGLTRAAPSIARRFPNNRIDNEEIVIRGLGRVGSGTVRTVRQTRDLLRGDLNLSPSPRQRALIEEGRPGGQTGVFTTDADVLEDTSVSQFEQEQRSAAVAPQSELGSEPVETLDATTEGEQNIDTGLEADSETESEIEDDLGDETDAELGDVFDSEPEGDSSLPLQSEIQGAGDIRSFLRGEEGAGPRLTESQVEEALKMLPENVRQLAREERGQASLVGRQQTRVEEETQPEIWQDYQPGQIQDEIFQGARRQRRATEGTFEDATNPLRSRGGRRGRTRRGFETEVEAETEPELSFRAEVFSNSSQDIGVGQQPRQSQSVFQQPTLGLEVGLRESQQIDVFQELGLGVETETMFETETELEQELETETEFESEMENEFETETESETEFESEFETESETETEMELFRDDEESDVSAFDGFGESDDLFDSGIASADDVADDLFTDSNSDSDSLF